MIFFNSKFIFKYCLINNEKLKIFSFPIKSLLLLGKTYFAFEKVSSVLCSSSIISEFMQTWFKRELWLLKFVVSELIPFSSEVFEL